MRHVPSQLFEVDLGIERLPRIGHRTFHEPTEPGVGRFAFPNAVHDDHPVVGFLKQDLGNVRVEEYVPIRNDGVLKISMLRFQRLEQGDKFSGFGKIVVVHVGQVGQRHGLLFIAANDSDVLDADRIVCIDDVRQDRQALNRHHGFGSVLRQFSEFVPSGRGQDDPGQAGPVVGQIAFLGLPEFGGILKPEDFGYRRNFIFDREQVLVFLQGACRFLHDGHGRAEEVIGPNHQGKAVLPEHVRERGIILGRHDHHRTAIAPFLLEGQNFVRDRQGAMNEDAVGTGLGDRPRPVSRLRIDPSRK